MKQFLKKLVGGGGSDSPSIKTRYRLGKVIGEGACGTVRIAVDLATEREWACKTITKEKERELAKMEIRLLQRLSHPNLLRYREHFDKKHKLYIIFELLRGPDLFTDLETRGSYTEDQARYIMRQLLDALTHMHDQGIVHRDLKLENVMLTKNDGSLDLCIVDFGFAEELADDAPRVADRRGSLDYAAPEVLRSELAPGTSGDIWSAGVMLYAMLSNTFPFYGRTGRDTSLSIQRAEVKFEDPVWKTRSAAARSMVQAMLTRDASARPTAKELLSHAWLRDEAVADHPASEVGAGVAVVAGRCNSLSDRFIQADHSLAV